MATCRDCIHFDACVDRLGTTKFYDNDIAVNNVEDLCKTFKDKSLVLDLPCKVGDTVYVIFKEKNYIMRKCRVDEFVIGKKEMIAVLDICYADFIQRRHKSIPVSWFGLFAFTEKNEAEIALRELSI